MMSNLQKLNQLAQNLIRAANVQAVLDDVLAAIIAMMGLDFPQRCGSLVTAILKSAPHPDLETLQPDVSPTLIDLVYPMLEKDSQM